MVAESENIASVFPSLCFPRLMPWEAVSYIRAAIARSKGRCSQWEAAELLVDAIKCGRLLAYGDDRNGQERVIPINDFALTDAYPGSGYPNEDSRGQCVFRWFDNGRRGVDSDFIEKGGQIIWRNVNIDTIEVRRLWPWTTTEFAPEPSVALPDKTSGQNTTTLTRSQIDKLYVDYLKSCGPGHMDAQFEEAKEAVGIVITRERFRKIREGVPDSHGIVGAHPKSRRGK